MEIKVYTIQFDTPPWLRRAVVYLAVPAAAILGVSAVVYADVVVPNTFATGDVLDAEKMNDNFSALQNGLNTLGTSVGKLESGSVCGATPAIYTGNLGGYAGAAAICAGLASCNDATAHICTSSEVIRAESRGPTNLTGMVAAGGFVRDAPGGTSEFFRDCIGFTSAADLERATRWEGAAPGITVCSQTTNAVLCCD